MKKVKQKLGYIEQRLDFYVPLSYYHAMDMFGNVPFVDENTVIGVFVPQIFLDLICLIG